MLRALQEEMKAIFVELSRYGVDEVEVEVEERQ